ncbi:MAG: hypothetical protein ACQESD_02790 [Thermoplasmatota archaeon]
MAVGKEGKKDFEDSPWTLKQIARYPFLSSARSYIKEEGPPLEEIINSRMWGMSRQRGKERVIQALEDGKVDNRSLSDEVECEIELFSYPIARILVSCVSDNFLTRRYALGEAEKMMVDLNNESSSTLLDIGAELGLKGVHTGDGVSMSFITYLENTERLRAPEWKLVNQDLRSGEIFLDEKRYRRIMKEKLVYKISDELPLPVNDDLIDAFESQITEIQELLEKVRAEFVEVDLGKVETELFPPCIKKLLALQREGINLSHEARFAMTAFMHKIGMTEEGILNMFSESPDFDKNLALYQIEHIIGKVSGTEYTPPGCDLMKTNGICHDLDSLCRQEWMKHPLRYYSFKKKHSSGESKSSEDEEDNSEDEENKNDER